MATFYPRGVIFRPSNLNEYIQGAAPFSFVLFRFMKIYLLILG